MQNFPVPSFLPLTNFYEVNIRQYTPEGTFAAFADHLPRLKDMGVEVLWLMPVHPIGVPHRKGSAGSYYSISDHRAINPEFGTIDDFDALVARIHELNMKVVMDWVANHAAWDHVWTKTHPHFFVQENGAFQTPYDWTDVIQINHKEPEQQQAMMEAMRFWVEEKKVDGFRADLAHLTPLDFWQKARRYLSEFNSELIWLAESEEITYTQAFDITFTWRWMHETARVIGNKLPADELLKFFKEDDFPGLRLYFTSNHDENSWNGTEYEKYDQHAKALTVFSMFFNRAVPMIYSGQELPNAKRLQFFEKDAIAWNHPPLLHNFYKTLLHLRKRYAELDTENFTLYDTSRPILFTRRNKSGELLHVALNLSAETITWCGGEWAIKGRDAFQPERAVGLEDEVSLAPGEYLLLEDVVK